MSEPSIGVPRETINALAIRRRLGKGWTAPFPYGDDCWVFDSRDGRRIIVSPWMEPDGVVWLHASMSYQDTKDMPTYDDLKLLHKAAFDEGYSYQAFVPTDEHISIRDNVLHLWGKEDGTPALPDFGRFGTI